MGILEIAIVGGLLLGAALLGGAIWGIILIARRAKASGGADHRTDAS